MTEAADESAKYNPLWVAEAEHAFDSQLLDEGVEELEANDMAEFARLFAEFESGPTDNDTAVAAIAQQTSSPPGSVADAGRAIVEDERAISDDPLRERTPQDGQEPIVELRLVRLDTLLNRPIPRRQLVAGTILERGVVTLLAAAPGAGKTTFAVHLVAAIAKGEAWAGFDVPQPGVVIYVNAEETQHEVNRRFQAVVLDADLDAAAISRVKMINREGALRLMEKPDGRPKPTDLYVALSELIVHAEPAAVVLDPLALIHDLDENYNSDMTALQEHLHEFARTANCAILLVHHARKDAKGASMDASRGASSLAASARAMFVLTERVDGKGKPTLGVQLTCVKSNKDARDGRDRAFHRGTVRLPSGDEVGTLIPSTEG